jgi:hypothetical protein
VVPKRVCFFYPLFVCCILGKFYHKQGGPGPPTVLLEGGAEAAD